MLLLTRNWFEAKKALPEIFLLCSPRWTFITGTRRTQIFLARANIDGMKGEMANQSNFKLCWTKLYTENGKALILSDQILMY